MNLSAPAAHYLSYRSLESTRLSQRRFKRRRITAGAIFNSATALSKSTRSTAAAGSRSITAASTIPNQCRRDTRCDARPRERSSVAVLGREQNHPRKLKDRGNELEDNPRKEWPECPEECSVVQL